MTSITLGDLGRFVGGGTPSRKKPEYFSGSIPWATVKDFKSDRIVNTKESISEEGLENSSARVVPAGSLLIVTRMGLGKVAIADTDLAINQDIKALMPEGTFDVDYLLAACKALGPAIERLGTGATVKGITLTTLRALTIPLPPLEEQRRIVDILNRAASIQRLRNTASTHLHDFIPALFTKMFGDPVDNPMGWDKHELGLYIADGPQNGLYRPKGDYGSGTPILRIDSFYGGKTVPQDQWQRLRLSDKDIEKYVLHENDIVINRVNSRPYLGKSTIIPRLTEQAVFESNMMRFSLNTPSLMPRFLIEQLQLGSMRDALRTNAKDAINQASINQKDVQSLRVIVPPTNLQNRFTTLVNAVTEKAQLATRADVMARDLSASLLDKLLSDDRG
ncbi:restriction endonuclease subunit S [Leisingera sp. ANG-DT]|uniref:restriction endonuclease subunit S n=1 Tax=Leisingera sp. ANG-DT TaxID=1577897 RepID=UPI000689B8A1|nr:restriction endonuclease subunit S [Leisingera sp. ANG-DT]